MLFNLINRKFIIKKSLYDLVCAKMNAKKRGIVDFGLIVFDSNQVDEIISDIGLKFNRNDYLVSGAKTIKCDCCNHTIKRSNLGNVLPGSNLIYCDNPSCFTEYMGKHLDL